MCILDDPYYCGLRARVPNFVNGKQTKHDTNRKPMQNPKKGSSNPLSPPPSRSTPNLPSLAQLPGAAPPFWWHSRLYPDSGIGGNPISKRKKILVFYLLCNTRWMSDSKNCVLRCMYLLRRRILPSDIKAYIGKYIVLILCTLICTQCCFGPQHF